MSNDPLTRSQATAIGQAVNKPASTIYRWRNDNPELFAAVTQYALKSTSEPTPEDAYSAGRRAVGLGISDCPYVTASMTDADKAFADAWIQGLSDAEKNQQSSEGIDP